MKYRDSAIKYLLEKKQITEDEIDTVEIGEVCDTLVEVFFNNGEQRHLFHFSKRLLDRMDGELNEN